MRKASFLVLLISCFISKGQDVQSINSALVDCDYIGEAVNGFIRVKREAGYGFYNITMGSFTRCDFEFAQNFSEDRAWVRLNGMWHVMNSDGTLTPSRYGSPKPFNDGLARVDKGKKYTFVDYNLNECVGVFMTDTHPQFSEGILGVEDNYGKWGYVDKNGEWVIPPSYLAARPFHEGIAAVKVEDGWTFISRSGNRITNQCFQAISDFNEGAAVVHVGEGTEASILDKNDSTVPFYARKIGAFHGGIAHYQVIDNPEWSVNRMYVSALKFGYLHHNEHYQPAASVRLKRLLRSGEDEELIVNSKYYTLIAPLFDDVLDFSCGLGAVRQDDKWAYINGKGEYLCCPSLDEAGQFRNGIARVRMGSRIFFIDTVGTGLPSHSFLSIDSLSLELKAKNVACWYEDAQYEQALVESVKLYKSLVERKGDNIPELSHHELELAGDLIKTANSSQGILVSLFDQSFHMANLYYRGLQAPKRMSFQGGSPYLNKINGASYLSSLEGSLPDSLSSQVHYYLTIEDYERVAFLMEGWAGLKDCSQDVWLALYYILQLAGMSSHVNDMIPQYYTRIRETLEFPSLENAVILGETKRFRSASAMLHSLICKEHDPYRKAVLYHNWGLMARSYADYQTAGELLIKSVDEYSRSLNSPHKGEYANELYLEALSALISCPVVTRTERTHSLLDEYVNQEIKLSSSYLYAMDTRSSAKPWEFSLRRIYSFINALDTKQDEDFIRAAFKLNAFKNHVYLDIQNAWQRLVNINTSDSVSVLRAEYSKVKERFLGDNPYSPTITGPIRSQFDSLSRSEAELKRIFVDRGDYADIAIYKTMPPVITEAASIDIIQYTDSLGLKRYGAFIIVPSFSQSPLFVKLLQTESYGFLPNTHEELSCVFWKPILTAIGELYSAKRIDISYNSLSHVGWEFLPYGDNYRMVMDQYEVHRQNNIFRRRTYLQEDPGKEDVIDVFAALEYGANNQSRTRGAFAGGRLLFSEAEIHSIKKALTPHFQVKVHKGKEGTFSSFMALNTNPPRLLHISTHGYQESIPETWSPYIDFLRDKDDRIRVENLNWLLNSTGLLLSFNPEKSTKGENILRSYQVANCDFSGMDLVVLSACSTSSGKTSEAYAGPMGLNYAFQLASVNNIITSLNDIDDQETARFMSFFYEALSSEERHDYYGAFKEAVRSMHDYYPTEPKYWTSFVLLEN